MTPVVRRGPQARQFRSRFHKSGASLEPTPLHTRNYSFSLGHALLSLMKVKFRRWSAEDACVTVAMWVFFEYPSEYGLSGSRPSREIASGLEQPCPPVTLRRYHLQTQIPLTFANYKQTMVGLIGIAVERRDHFELRISIYCLNCLLACLLVLIILS